MTMDLSILNNHPELAKNLKLEISGADLRDFAKLCIDLGRQENQRPIVQEQYLTSAQVAEFLQISLVTLWQWDKKGITKPITIGKLKRYRRSDLEKTFSSEK